jgi:hypothetical protein
LYINSGAPNNTNIQNIFKKFEMFYTGKDQLNMSRRKERAQKLAEKQEFAEKRHRLLNVLVQRLLVRINY